MFTLPLLLCGLTSAAVMLLLVVVVIVGAHARMAEHGSDGYPRDYLSPNTGHRDDNRGVPDWYTTPYIGPDGTVYDQPLIPRVKMGRDL